MAEAKPIRKLSLLLHTVLFELSMSRDDVLWTWNNISLRTNFVVCRTVHLLTIQNTIFAYKSKHFLSSIMLLHCRRVLGSLGSHSPIWLENFGFWQGIVLAKGQKFLKQFVVLVMPFDGSMKQYSPDRFHLGNFAIKTARRVQQIHCRCRYIGKYSKEENLEDGELRYLWTMQ